MRAAMARKDPQVPVSVLLPASLKARLRVKARAEGLTLSAYLRRLAIWDDNPVAKETRAA